MANHQDIYRQWATNQEGLPLFLQPWWMDAVCLSDHWSVALVFDKEQKILAALPYHILYKKGIKIIGLPYLTPYMGIYIHYPTGLKRTSIYDHEKTMAEQLIAQLPITAYMQQKFYPEFTYGLPFFWKGFKLDWRYTYHLSLQQSEETIWQDMEGSARTQLLKTLKQVTITKSDDAVTLYRLVSMTFNKQGLKTPYSQEEFDRLYLEVRAHNAGSIYLAYKIDTMEPIAGMFMVKDKNTVYNLVLGRDHHKDPGGSIHGILWTCIKEHIGHYTTFDFEGSMLEGPERMFRSFGSIRKPVLQVTRYKNRWWKAVLALAGK